LESAHFCAMDRFTAIGGLLWRLHDRRPIVEKTCIGAETVTGFWAIFFVA